MSLSTLESSLLATFDRIWETEDFSFADNESEIFLLDIQPLISTPSNSGPNFTDPSNTNFREERVTVGCTASPQAGIAEEANQEANAKPVAKKRKTWGQELPIPTTNLPPRKRAKTEAEKEQRRVERVLRNRAAAQSSRERKRKEVESLETERSRLSESNTDLKVQLLAQQATNSALSRELEAITLKLKQYEQYLNVESRAPELGTDDDDNLFQFLVNDAVAPVSTIDPSVLEWRGALCQREPLIGVDGRS